MNITFFRAGGILKKTFGKTVMTPSVEKAKKFVSEIPDEIYNKLSNSLFRNNGQDKAIFLKDLDEIETFFSKQNIEIPQNVQNSYQKLKHKALVFADRMETSISKGNNIKNSMSYNKKFYNRNKEDLKTLESFFESNAQAFRNKCDYDRYRESLALRNKFNSLEYSVEPKLYRPGISEVHESVLNPNGIYFHGSKSPRKLLKNGFDTTGKIQTKGSREFGDAVYVTPNKQVASYFAGIKGGILPVKVNAKKIASINELQFVDMNQGLFGENLSIRYITPLEKDLIVKELFKRNGFDAVYSKGAVEKNFVLGNVTDTLIGAPQTQIAVFDSKNVSILKKSYRERVENQILQLKTRLNAFKNIKNIFSNLKN